MSEFLLPQVIKILSLIRILPSMRNFRWVEWGTAIFRRLHLINNGPVNIVPQRARGIAGIPWRLNCQNNPCPREIDRRLWHIGGTLDVSARKSRRNYVYTGRHAQGKFDTKLCRMGRELDTNFSKLSNSLGKSRPTPSGGSIDMFITVDSADVVIICVL